MKTITYQIADPAGNITALVTSGNVEPKDYAEVANKIMAASDGYIEQVGYLVEPKEGGRGRLEMMGGEFCGNGARSYALYLVLQDMVEEEKKGEKANEDIRTIQIEETGFEGLLTCRVDAINGKAFARIPKPGRIGKFNYNGTACPLIIVDGIAIVLVFDGLPAEDKALTLLRAVCRQTDQPAAGVMYLDRPSAVSGATIGMQPVVYVKQTDSLVYESSCGAGTTAAGAYLSKDRPDGIFSYRLHQPGGTLEITVIKEGGEITACEMGGDVSLGEIRTIEV